MYQRDLILKRFMFMDEMIQKISAYPNGTYLKVIWSYGKEEIEGILATVYETDNGLEEDDDGYEEFYAVAIKVKKIIGNFLGNKIDINQLVEVSQKNQPIKITLKDGSIIWEKQI